tara:strand:- start:316 stop:582 length:267 start_codon:yes stop_codon:yes gene_type:complete
MKETDTKDMRVRKDNKLKEWLVDYVGNRESPEDELVTVEMIVHVIAEEFPEFLFVVAQENFLRGYEQALEDVKVVENKYNEKQDNRVH